MVNGVQNDFIFGGGLKRTSVGIMTIVKVDNYGAELQAYATVCKLRQMGYNAEIIDYLYYKSYMFKDTAMSAPLLKMGKKESLLYWLKYRVINTLISKIGTSMILSVKNRKRRFKLFHEENTPFSKKQYRSMDELYTNPPFYDIYITGSDQVWNPVASSSIEPYFLTFTKSKKISYASSFGVEKIQPDLRYKIGQWLSEYAHISVREQNACAMVKDFCGKEAVFVLDPTLLLNKEQWLQVANKLPNIPEHYVLIYQLSTSPAIVDLARRIGKEKNIPVFRITKRAYMVEGNDGVTNILDAGPAEFISLIDGADYVITNSFHGTAFSVNFGKPFYSVISAKKKNNSRLESLLGLVGLSSRIIKDSEDMKVLDYNYSIDFDSLQERLSRARKESEKYLKEAIEN